jgi:predicted DCC family thiol-disulfide oxidoreductase YuxK
MIQPYARNVNRAVPAILLKRRFLFVILLAWSSPARNRAVAAAFQNPTFLKHNIGQRTSITSLPAVSTTPQEEAAATIAVTRRKFDTGPIILFDGVCNFCNAWVDILLHIDQKKIFKFAPLQSTVGQELLISIGRRPNDISSVVYIDNETFYDKSDCVLQVLGKTLGVPAGPLAVAAVEALVPLQWRDQIYDTVAENRYNLLGKRDECRCGDPQYSDRFLA